jgi:hypothetical protein
MVPEAMEDTCFRWGDLGDLGGVLVGEALPDGCSNWNTPLKKSIPLKKNSEEKAIEEKSNEEQEEKHPIEEKDDWNQHTPLTSKHHWNK